MRVLVTGGSGFIGSALCLHLVNDLGHEVVNVDALTYAANLEKLELLNPARIAEAARKVCYR